MLFFLPQDYFHILISYFKPLQDDRLEHGIRGRHTSAPGALYYILDILYFIFDIIVYLIFFYRYLDIGYWYIIRCPYTSTPCAPLESYIPNLQMSIMTQQDEHTIEAEDTILFAL